ncbi:hypothetical protein Gogos_005454 [Gossypium gossypioides]|uniref:Uncharacterized protein n=1 Tax=Gossypium gossypioides TaxID=34282 RepID=A0A7J9D3K8_GOSGO|nr:hypothetical protein [Gossypium gossypioides]
MFVKPNDALLRPWYVFGIALIGVLCSMKWIWYRLSRNILPFSTMTLEIRSRYILSRTLISEDP